MSRNLKVLGLAIVAALSLSALAAPTSQALKFKAGSYPASLTGEQSTTKVLELSGGGKFECAKVTDSGTLSEASEQFEISSESGECTMEIKGTKYAAKTTVTCLGTYSHTVIAGFTHETCSFFYTHHVAAFNDAKMTEQRCLYDIAELGKAEGVTQENLGGTKGVKITYNLSGIGYERSEGTEANCGSASGSATYKGSSIFTAKKEGQPVSFELS